MGAITAIFGAIGSAFNWLTNRSTIKNAANIQAAQTAQDQVNAETKTAQAIAQKNTQEIENELAE